MLRGTHITPSTLLVLAGVCALAPFSLGSNADPASPTPPAAQAPVPVPSPAPAADQDEKPEVVLYLRDGRRFGGLLIKQNMQEVVIQISGIPTRFTTDQIDRIDTTEPVSIRYKQLRESVGDDPEQILHLAEWLQSRERYELALAEVQRVLRLDSTNAGALKLRMLLEQQILLKLRAQRAAPQPADKDPDNAEHPVPHAKPIDFPLLTQEQVNLMKVYEVDLQDNPRLLIQRDAITKLLDRYANHPLIPITREGRDAIYHKPPTEILDLMFRLQARDLYKDVEVLDQPRPFVLFRDQVERTWLLNSCATNQCHGGAEAGRLVLYNHRPNAERSVYTNFYILTHFQLADGTPIINWENPDRSPLLQMALPRERSRFPHPVVSRGVAGRDAFKPAFRSTDDHAFIASVDWLKSLYRPRPSYPFEYMPLKPFTVPPASPAVTPPTTAKPAAPAAPSTPPAPTNPTTDKPSSPVAPPSPEPRQR